MKLGVLNASKLHNHLPLPDPFSLGSANVSQEVIEAVRIKTFEQLDVLYKRASTDYQRDKNWQALISKLENWDGPQPKKFSSLILEPYMLEGDSNETKYTAKIYYDLSKLDTSEPVGSLLIPLSQRIMELGFPCRIAEMRVEKGCFTPGFSLWHYDGSAAKTSIITSFSNRKDWSTRVVDEKNKVIPNRKNNCINSSELLAIF